MKLALKKSLTRWVKVGKENEEFYIDYPSIEQEQELQSIKFGDKYSGVDKMMRHAQAYLKFVIKDWKNINDSDGKAIGCKIIDNELEYNLWWALVSNQGLLMELFNICWKELELTENDKKKLSSQDSSSEKANLVE